MVGNITPEQCEQALPKDQPEYNYLDDPNNLAQGKLQPRKKRKKLGKRLRPSKSNMVRILRALLKFHLHFLDLKNLLHAKERYEQQPKLRLQKGE